MLSPELKQAFVTNATEQINAHNLLAEQIKNTGDRVALKASIFENPETLPDAEVTQLINEIKDLETRLEDLHAQAIKDIEPFIQAALKRSGVEQKMAEADDLLKVVNASLAYMRAAGFDEETLNSLPKVEGRPNRTRTTNAGTGTSAPKYRNLNVYVDGELVQEDVKKVVDNKNVVVKVSNLTFGAKHLGISSEALRTAFTNAAGTTDADKFPERTSFNLTDPKGVEHAVVIVKTPKGV